MLSWLRRRCIRPWYQPQSRDSSRKARAKVQSRLTVADEMLEAADVSWMSRPPKNRSSTMTTAASLSRRMAALRRTASRERRASGLCQIALQPRHERIDGRRRKHGQVIAGHHDQLESPDPRAPAIVVRQVAALDVFR